MSIDLMVSLNRNAVYQVLPIQLCMRTPHSLLASHCTRSVGHYRWVFASSITHLSEEAALGFSNFTLREDPTVGLLYFHFVFSATQELLPRNAIAPGTGALGHY